MSRVWTVLLVVAPILFFVSRIVHVAGQLKGVSLVNPDLPTNLQVPGVMFTVIGLLGFTAILGAPFSLPLLAKIRGF